MLLRSSLVALALTLGGSLAQAQGLRHSCDSDLAKFCQDVRPGGGRLRDCLKQHENELSDQCRAAGERMKARENEFKASCQGDVDQFCKDVQPGGGRIIHCLKQHEGELSAGCKDFAAKHKRGEHAEAEH